MPNPWDAGSARLLETLGFEALATTSAGFAWSLGKLDQKVTRDELVAHVAALAAATAVPLNVDSERCYPDEPGGVAETVALLGEAGAAGCSIEDYDPAAGAIDDVERRRRACRRGRGGRARARDPIVLTGRAREPHPRRRRPRRHDRAARRLPRRRRGRRLRARAHRPRADPRVVEEVGLPVNVLALPAGAARLRAGAGRRAAGLDRRLACPRRLGAALDAATELRDQGNRGLRQARHRRRHAPPRARLAEHVVEQEQRDDDRGRACGEREQRGEQAELDALIRWPCRRGGR